MNPISSAQKPKCSVPIVLKSPATLHKIGPNHHSLEDPLPYTNL